MIREIEGRTWFCCPQCGKKLHPVDRGARGVYVMCKQKRRDGTRCCWSGEVRWDNLKSRADEP